MLVVDKTIAADPDVSIRIERLINDLAGDGWRVLRHDVERGPEHPDDGIQPEQPDPAIQAAYDQWAQQNAPRVREVRALIKADYDAAPTEVKEVFDWPCPVPYSGVSSSVEGGHYGGPQPADAFYGDIAAHTEPVDGAIWLWVRAFLFRNSRICRAMESSTRTRSLRP